MKVCDKCYAELEDSASYCSECGVPLANGKSDNLAMEGSDREVYPELAKANLFRMRGQWKEAEDTAIGILRRFPNNVTAHALLGDICADQGRLDDAIVWYQDALELNPNGVAERHKLDSLKKRKEQDEQAKARHTAAQQQSSQIERITPDSRTWTYVMLGVFLVLLLGAGFYTIRLAQQPNTPGSGRASTNTPTTNLQTPPAVPPASASNNPNQTPNANPGIPGASSSNPASSTFGGGGGGTLTNTEAQFLNDIRQRDAEAASRIVSISYDPRIGGRLMVSFRLSGGAVNRDRVNRDAFQTAQAVFGALPSVNAVTLRALAPSANGMETLFIADCQRQAILATPAANFNAQLAAQVFQNPFYASGI